MMTFNRRKQPAPPLSVTDPAILIRINRLYRDGMTEDELYDATRSCWKLGSRRNRAKYALAVFEGVVQEVYEIDGWHEGAGPRHARVGFTRNHARKAGGSSPGERQRNRFAQDTSAVRLRATSLEVNRILSGM